MSRVNVPNGQSLAIKCAGSSNVYEHVYPSSCMALNDIFLAPCITYTMLSVSNFSKDNKVDLSFVLISVSLNLKFLKLLYLNAFFIQVDCTYLCSWL